VSYAGLLAADPRARRKLPKPPVAFEGHGFQMVRFEGGDGDYWDVRFPDCDIRELPYFSLFESGGIESVSEADGIFYRADRDEPWGVTLAGEQHWKRKEGRTRMFFLPDTRRLCIYPINPLGMPSFEPIKCQHVKGPFDVKVPLGGLVIASVGQAGSTERIEWTAAFGVVRERDGGNWHFPAGSYGAVAWKL